MIKLIDILKEIGNISVAPYDYKYNGSEYQAFFTTEKGTKYIVYFDISEGKMKVDFGVLSEDDDEEDEYVDFEIKTNEGNIYRIMSTIISIIRRAASEFKPNQIEIDANPKKMRLYKMYLKNLDGYILTKEDTYNLILQRKEVSKVKTEHLNILKEIKQFSNWKMPSTSQLKQEFKIEQEMKGNEFWEDEADFLNAVKNGKIVTITSNEDQNIDYRSGTESYEELLDLLKSYRSYPEFRNEETLKAIYGGFKTNQSMDYPIVIEDEDGSQRIFSGNTRMDVAFQLGINPKVLLVKGEL